jgi:hypothetical protein
MIVPSFSNVLFLITDCAGDVHQLVLDPMTIIHINVSLKEFVGKY